MTVCVYKNANLRGAKGNCDIVTCDGIISKIIPASPESPAGAETVDLEGRLVLPPYVESHIHLDYVYSALDPRNQTESSTLFEAIDNWDKVRQQITVGEYKKRALEAISHQIEHGVQYVRSHVDVTDKSFKALQALCEVKEEVKDLIDIQLVAFPQEGYYACRGGAELVEEALKQGCAVVGGIPHYEFTREDGIASIKKGFELAQKYGCLIDFHCDETDDEQSRFVETMAALTYYSGMQGRVAASHTCAMGSYNKAYAFKMMNKFQKAQLNFISCPTENTFLQGRYDNYPRRRGLTRVDELLDSGLNVSFGQDSISDPWYPLGTGNLMTQVFFGIHVCHLMTPEYLSKALDLVTCNPAKTLCLEDYGLKEGNSASFVVLDATDEIDAIRCQADVILSVRRGKTIMQKQPTVFLKKPF